METLFHTCALVALAATLIAITRPEPVHALLNLIVSVLAAAGVMLAIGAPLAAALQVLLYAGAILVLFVFVVMLIQPGARERECAWLAPRHWLLPAAMSALVLSALLLNFGDTRLGEVVAPVDVKTVGVHFYGPYLLAVELGSFLLLAGLVSAWRIGRPAERA